MASQYSDMVFYDSDKSDSAGLSHNLGARLRQNRFQIEACVSQTPEGLSIRCFPIKRGHTMSTVILCSVVEIYTPRAACDFVVAIQQVFSDLPHTLYPRLLLAQ